MSKRVCGEDGCPVLVDKGARDGCCDEHRRAKDKARGSAQARGYGHEHRRTRAELMPDAYGKPCLYCGQPMRPDQALALDHTEDRTGYRGIVHADYRDCPAGGNAAEGARRGNSYRS